MRYAFFDMHFLHFEDSDSLNLPIQTHPLHN